MSEIPTMPKMPQAANLGFPRIGMKRELKKAVEAYWKGVARLDELLVIAKNIRQSNWEWQKEAGIEFIPSNDFSFYDQVLDMTTLLGAVPKRFGEVGEKPISLDLYFAMARGTKGAKAMEMTKWFDTNYHYIVPELNANTKFKLSHTKIFDEYQEAKALNIETRPVLLGPVSYLHLSHMKDGTNRWDLLEGLLKTYQTIFARLEKQGASWIQIDEPCLVLDLDDETKQAFVETYQQQETDINIMLATYFGDITHHLDLIKHFKIKGLHIDMVRSKHYRDYDTKLGTNDTKFGTNGTKFGTNGTKFGTSNTKFSTDETPSLTDRTTSLTDEKEPATRKVATGKIMAEKAATNKIAAEKVSTDKIATSQIGTDEIGTDEIETDKEKPDSTELIAKTLPEHMVLSLGLVDGRNIWINDLESSIKQAKKIQALRQSASIQIAPSCSLLHVPVDLTQEAMLDEEIKSWLAFGRQKLDEIKLIKNALLHHPDKSFLQKNARALSVRKNSPRIHNKQVKARLEAITQSMTKRNSEYKARQTHQKDILKLPLLPTTTIGSFPQTSEVRQARAAYKKGALPRKDYQAFLEKTTKDAILWQEEIGLDVLVHGEFERNDMVEYFGERLEGFCFTKMGWVQSYGSRCVKPPIIFGDVSRPKPMTIDWALFAQSHTKKPVKGMLTGPVTILQWSFVRDDQPEQMTCKQIALAMRDEVLDLEKAGIKIIQIDEAALREGLPLRKKHWQHYLNWAVQSFKLAASGVKDKTQIHTHMCYSDFNDIIQSVALMDADVISIETSRSNMKLLDAFIDFQYPNDIGPGIWDIHSPRIPEQKEMEELLKKALKVLSPQQVWVNPDCGLKTRGWQEVREATQILVKATQQIRQNL